MRGLTPFAESEREFFYGRDQEVADLVSLVRSDYFRAGLLYGPSGVGKTSLMHAGLFPILREHGVVVATCDSYAEPNTAFAASVCQVTGLRPRDGEDALTFLARIVEEAPVGQHYLFAIDNVDLALTKPEFVQQLGDAYARVVTRSSGKGRFLFCCAETEVYRLTALERRTGSIFPANCRFHLRGVTPDVGAQLIASQFAGGLDAQLSSEIATQLSEKGRLLPAELQLACLALRDLSIGSQQELAQWGGPHALSERWIEQVTEHLDDKSVARRMLHAIASALGGWSATENLAARAGVDVARAGEVLGQLYQFGLIQMRGADVNQAYVALAHPVLRERMLRVTRNATELADDARALLAEKSAAGGRLSHGQLKLLKSAGITPTNDDEATVFARTKRFYQMITVAAIAVPLFLLAVMWIAQRGAHYYEKGEVNGQPVLLVKSGKTGIFSAFHWLGFGDTVANTGLSPAVASEKAIDALDGQATDSFSKEYTKALRSERSAVASYLVDGDKDAIKRLLDGDGNLSRRMTALAAIAPGEGEVSQIGTLLRSKDQATRSGALAVAISAARRGSDRYEAILRGAAKDSDDKLASQVRGAVRQLPRKAREQIIEESDAPKRSKLATSSLSHTIRMLQEKKVSKEMREGAQRAVVRAMRRKDANAIEAAIEVAADGTVPKEERLWLLAEIAERGNKALLAAHADTVRPLSVGKDKDIAALAWAVLAVMDPNAISLELAPKLDSKKEVSEEMRALYVPAWGYISRAGDKTLNNSAVGAFEILLKGVESRDLRPYAPYYGFAGREPRKKLEDLAKEGGSSEVPGVLGLANATANRGSSGAAMKYLNKMWKRKGRSRRRAADILARMARYNKSSPLSLLRKAAFDKDYESLHTVGVEGLCVAMAAGSSSARRTLRSFYKSDNATARAHAAGCFRDLNAYPKDAFSLAERMADDASEMVRLEVAHIMANLADEPPKGSDKVLTRLINDRNRGVRLAALNALERFGDKAPEGIAEALANQLAAADETEKMQILRAAKHVVTPGLLSRAQGDQSGDVRKAAIGLAVESKQDVGTVIARALTDSRSGVRAHALKMVGKLPPSMHTATIKDAVVAATADDDRDLRIAALAAAVALDSESASKYFAPLATSPSEEQRVVAAEAASTLAEGAPDKALEILQPLLEDSAYDVRGAAFSAAALALASRSAESLSKELERAEHKPVWRLATAAALAMKSQKGDDASSRELAASIKRAPPMGRIAARLAEAVVKKNLDPREVFRLFVP